MLFKIHHLHRSLVTAGWDKLLSEWSKMIDKSDERTQRPSRDVAYWYGERSLTGLLAAAAWKLKGGWSLEEWTARRGSGRSEGAARGDLWLRTGNGEFTIEAKATWPSRTWKSGSRYASNALDVAENQLRRLDTGFRYGKPVALCYIVPRVAQFPVVGIDDRIEEFFMNCPRGCKEFDLLASYRPDDPCPESDGRKYPGVILVGRICMLHWK